MGLTAAPVMAQASAASVEAALRARQAREKEQETSEKAVLMVPDQQVARRIAEEVYNTWRVSLIRGNEQAWKSSTSLSRQIKVRNLIVSQRGQFPRDYFSEAQEMPKLENFRHVGSLCAAGGRTMAVTYYGRVQLGEKGESAETAIVLLLVNENGKWKYDQSRFFNLGQLPKVAERLKKKDVSVLREQDGFHPYAHVPSVPRACGAPELIGKIFVDCPGRDIEMTINGVSTHEFYDERRADVVSGGLRRGRNTISYKVRDCDGLSRPALGIGLFVMPETAGNTPICVYDHILDAKDSTTGGSFTFTIGNAHIAAMNPDYKGIKPQPYHAAPLKKKPDGKKSGK